MISDLEITRAVMKEYDIRDNFYNQILEDVRHILDILFTENIFKIENANI